MLHHHFPRFALVLIGLQFLLQGIVSIPKVVIPCPLSWVEMISGEKYPDSFIPASKYGNEYVICRAKGFVGYANKGQCHTFNGTNVTSHEVFHALTNPFECELKWIPNENEEDTETSGIKLSSDIEQNVGRVMSPVEMRLLSGHVSGIGTSSEILVAISESNGTNISDEFEVLQSTQIGLRLVVTDIKFEEGTTPPQYIPRVLGIDQIVNRSPGTISQTVRHTSRYESINKFSEASWGPVEAITFEFQYATTALMPSPVEGIEIPMNYKEIYFDKPYVYDEESLSYEKLVLKQYTEQQIQANVTFTVYPLTSVQICSTSNIIEGFEANFTGLGHYTAKGLTGAEIKALLEEFEVIGDVRDGEVIIQVKSQFYSSYFSSSMFLTAPLDLIGEGSCYHLAEVVDEIRRDLLVGSLSKIEINDKLDRLKKSISLMNVLQ